MDEHIIALLNTNLRVIIPDFGAFIVRQKNPRVIVFNEFLRYNDGLLVDYVARTENIDKEIAVASITEYATDASKKLESGKVLKIKGLGTLMRERSGKISFSEDFNLSEVAPETVVDKEPDREAKDAEPELTADSGTKSVVDNEPVVSPETADKQVSEAEAGSAAKPGEEGKSADVTEGKASEQNNAVSGAVRKSRTRKPVAKKAAKAVKKEIDQKAEREMKEEQVEAAGEVNSVVEEDINKDIEEKVEVAEDKVSEISHEVKDIVSEIKEDTGAISAAKLEETAEKDSATASATLTGLKKEAAEVKKVVDISKESTTVKEAVKEVKYDRSRKPVNVNQILVWILIILVVNIGILGYFMYGGKSNKAGSDITPVAADSTEFLDLQDTEVEPAIAGEAEETESGQAASASPAATRVQTAVAPLSTGSKFYIVAGCFKDEANADALVVELKAKGYNAVKFGKIDDLHAVSYSTYNSRSEALNELDKIRSEVQSDAWMTIY